jgi:hypothetical protein
MIKSSYEHRAGSWGSQYEEGDGALKRVTGNQLNTCSRCVCVGNKGPPPLKSNKIQNNGN